jgi:hypothetical protein
MVGKLLLSLILAGSVGAATVRLPASACMLVNAPSTQSCRPACCANKTCCQTSAQRTQVPAQPLLQSGQAADFVVALAQPAATNAPAIALHRHETVIGTLPVAHSPPSRVLLCTFLI